MRKALFCLVAFLLLGFISPVLSTNSPKIEISRLKYEPYPAQPGSYLHVYFNIMNSGTGDAEDLKLVLKPEYPFYLAESENATREIGTIKGLQNAVIDYKIRVAANAVEGENELTLVYKREGGYISVEKLVNINIQTLDANLAVKKFDTLKVAPGEIANLNITAKNEADSYLRDINVKLDLSDLPFSPVNSTEEKRIYQIGSKEEKNLNFNLLVSPDTSAGPYKIPLNISYYDSTGEKYTKKNHLTLIVSSTPEISVGIEESDLLTYGKTGEVTLNLINKGLSEVKFLTIELKDTEDYEIISTPKIYIGDLESDDYDTLEYKLYVNKEITNVPLKLNLDYRDSNNVKYSKEETVNLKLYSGEEMRKYNLVSEDYSIYILAGIGVIAILFYWRRRSRKKKK